MSKETAMKAFVEDHPELNMENFGDIMDGFLTDVDYRMVMAMPKGMQDVEIRDNIGAGPVIWLFALTAALIPTLKTLTNSILDEKKLGHFLDRVLEMVKHDVLEGVERNEDDTGAF